MDMGVRSARSPFPALRNPFHLVCRPPIPPAAAFREPPRTCTRAVPKPSDTTPDSRPGTKQICATGARTTWCAAAPANSSRLLLFLRSEHHDHLAPFHFRHLLDLTDFVEVGAQALKHAHADFLVSHFAAPETQ